eukprot:scaffold121659_cov27-Tisochrysis_lutea.AAC.1
MLAGAGRRVRAGSQAFACGQSVVPTSTPLFPIERAVKKPGRGLSGAMDRPQTFRHRPQTSL